MPDETDSTEHEELLDKFPLPAIFYETGKNIYWYQVKGDWIRATESHALQYLHSTLKISNNRPKGSPYSQAQTVLQAVREKQGVCYAGPVAGIVPGVYGEGDGRYISVGRPNLPEPKEGDWDDIRILANRLFGEAQLPYVWSWCKQACEGLYLNRKKFSQALMLAGGPGCGKSFWQVNVVSEMLGGRVAKPIQYMTGQTSFNSDLIGCEHLMLEDENVKRDHPSRRALGTAIKGFTVNTQQRVHAKGKDAFVVNSRHWITLSVNDEEENLHVLPPLDESIKDKITLVMCRMAINNDWPGPNGAVEDMEVRVKRQIPAFVWWLLNVWQIPVEITDHRFGVKSYQNPELLSRIDTGDQELELAELIERHWKEMAVAGKTLTITANEVFDALCGDPEVGYRAKKLLSWNNAAGTYLGRLVKRFPKRYSGTRTNKDRLWRIDFKEAV